MKYSRKNINIKSFIKEFIESISVLIGVYLLYYELSMSTLLLAVSLVITGFKSSKFTEEYFNIKKMRKEYITYISDTTFQNEKEIIDENTNNDEIFYDYIEDFNTIKKYTVIAKGVLTIITLALLVMFSLTSSNIRILYFLFSLVTTAFKSYTNVLISDIEDSKEIVVKINDKVKEYKDGIKYGYIKKQEKNNSKKDEIEALKELKNELLQQKNDKEKKNKPKSKTKHK